MSAPYNLIQIYHAVIHSTFRGYPTRNRNKEYTHEEIANITYSRIIDLPPTTSSLPLLHTAVLGPFNQINAERVRDTLKEVEGIIHIYIHSYTIQRYVVVQSTSIGHSLLSTLTVNTETILDTPEHLYNNCFIVPNRDIYVLRVSLCRKGIPKEIICSTVPTKTVIFFNISVEESTLLSYLQEEYQGVLEVKHVEIDGYTVVFILTERIDHATTLYTALIGRTINHQNIFIAYYPQILSDIRLYSTKK